MLIDVSRHQNSIIRSLCSSIQSYGSIFRISLFSCRDSWKNSPVTWNRKGVVSSVFSLCAKENVNVDNQIVWSEYFRRNYSNITPIDLKIERFTVLRLPLGALQDFHLLCTPFPINWSTHEFDPLIQMMMIEKKAMTVVLASTCWWIDKIQLFGNT